MNFVQVSTSGTAKRPCTTAVCADTVLHKRVPAVASSKRLIVRSRCPLTGTPCSETVPVKRIGVAAGIPPARARPANQPTAAVAPSATTEIRTNQGCFVDRVMDFHCVMPPVMQVVDLQVEP